MSSFALHWAGAGNKAHRVGANGAAGAVWKQWGPVSLCKCHPPQASAPPRILSRCPGRTILPLPPRRPVPCRQRCGSGGAGQQPLHGAAAARLEPVAAGAGGVLQQYAHWWVGAEAGRRGWLQGQPPLAAVWVYECGLVGEAAAVAWTGGMWLGPAESCFPACFLPNRMRALPGAGTLPDDWEVPLSARVWATPQDAGYGLCGLVSSSTEALWASSPMLSAAQARPRLKSARSSF